MYKHSIYPYYISGHIHGSLEQAFGELQSYHIFKNDFIG